MNPLAIAVQGIGFGALLVAAQGFGAPEQVSPALPIEKDHYRAIAAAVFNLRVDGPGNAIYTRIAMRRPRRK